MPPVTDDHEKSSTAYLKDRRFKLSRACDRCRRRRIKCDEGHPCQACQSSASECTFEETGKRSHPHKSKRTANLEDRMHQLESLIQAIPPSVFAAIGTPGPSGAPGGALDPSIAAAAAALFQSGPLPRATPILPATAAPLTNPANHFADMQRMDRRSSRGSGALSTATSIDQLAEDTARMSIAPSFHYRDNQGETRWQGETSGLPLLDMLMERHADPTTWPRTRTSLDNLPPPDVPTEEYMPPPPKSRASDLNSETLWKKITALIDPDLMDDLVKCFLSTSYYLLPFLHLPSFLEDYGSPEKWKEPGFSAFVVAVCCLSSRHIDDPRVRTNSDDGTGLGNEWFELFGRLRVLPGADRPTLYTIQAVFIGAVYAVGQGMLSRALSLLSEAVTLSIDAGLHRSVDAYDEFDPVESEVRKRTFWCVYLWDKQSSAHFGRPPMVRLRDCDVSEPTVLDDEYITHDGLGVQPDGIESRMSAFVCTIRLFVVLEAVLDTPPARPAAAFLGRATAVLSGFKRNRDLREEEALLDEVARAIPPHWAHTAETIASKDVVRVTQAERLHCFEQYVRLLIHRHRFSELVTERFMEGIDEQSEAEIESIIAAHGCAVRMVGAHLNIATRGLMTYYGVHVIHQLTAAGRSLVSIFLNCQADALQYLVPTTLEAMRSCCGLLKRFSGRYACGLRASDMMAEFCRLTQIPLDAPARMREGRSEFGTRTRGIWMRPLRKKRESSAVRSTGSSGRSPTHASGTPEMVPLADPFADAVPPGVHPGTVPGGPVPPPSYGYGTPGSSMSMSPGQQGHSLSISPAQRGQPLEMAPDPMLARSLVDGYAFDPSGLPAPMHRSDGADTGPDIAAFLAFLNGASDPGPGLGPSLSSSGIPPGSMTYGLGDERGMSQMYDPRLAGRTAGM